MKDTDFQLLLILNHHSNMTKQWLATYYILYFKCIGNIVFLNVFIISSILNVH